MLEGYIRLVRRVLPSPFSIAIALTVLSFLAVFILNVSNTNDFQIVETLDWWASGLWTPSLMVFAMQMMLMLVLGHALALSPVFESKIAQITARCYTSSQAAAVVCFFALTVGLFNWGLGLIFGAILARKMGESFTSRSLKLNYPLIGAAGYAALMIWHGGLSGSSLIKVAEAGNLHDLMAGSLTSAELKLLPDSIGIDLTVFSFGNILINSCQWLFFWVHLFHYRIYLPAYCPQLNPIEHLWGCCMRISHKTASSPLKRISLKPHYMSPKKNSKKWKDIPSQVLDNLRIIAHHIF